MRHLPGRTRRAPRVRPRLLWLVSRPGGGSGVARIGISRRWLSSRLAPRSLPSRSLRRSAPCHGGGPRAYPTTCHISRPLILSKSKMLRVPPLGTPTNTRYGDLSIKFGIMAKRHRVVSSKTYPYVAEIVPGVRAILVDKNYRTHRQRL